MQNNFSSANELASQASARNSADEGYPFADYEQGVHACLTLLQAKLGFSLWMLARVENENWIVLDVLDRHYQMEPGQVFRWCDSFCKHMIAGAGPKIAPDARRVPGYSQAPAALELDIGAYIAVPVCLRDGRLFGTLCAIDPHPQNAAIGQELPLVENMARLIASLLDYDLRLQQQQRRADLAALEASHDSLTGLKNRRGWDYFVDREEARCRRYGHPAGIIEIDIDGLQAVNERYGHAAGDGLLEKTALLLEQTIRKVDISARIGGDEFAVLVVEADARRTLRLCRRMLTAFRKAGIDASLSYAQREPDGSLEQAQRSAHQRMYRRKHRRRRAGTGGSPPSWLVADRQPVADEHPVRILLVDDSQDTRRLLALYLEHEQCRIFHAENGEQALQVWQRERPDLILLDVLMPGLSGFEVAQRIRAQEQTPDWTPILMLTALRDKKSLIHGIAAGATDFISKPFDVEELMARVRNQLEAKRVHDRLLQANIALSLSEQRTQAAQAQLNAAIETMGEAFALFDTDDCLILFNQRFVEYWDGIREHIRLGVPYRSLCEQLWDAGLVQNVRESRQQWLAQILLHHQQASGLREQQLGTRRWVQISERRLPDGCISMIITDISVRKQVEQEIQRVNNVLERKNDQLRQDLELAADLQRRIRPRISDFPFLKLRLKYLPFDIVSGDTYDMFLTRSGEFNFFLGDAMGHGVSAAFLTTMVHVGLESIRHDLPTDEIIRKLNTLLSSRHTGKFVTGAFLRITPEGLLSISNAGHPPLVIVPATAGEPRLLEKGGCPLGMFADEVVPYTTETYALQPGDRLLIYTDGLLEWHGDNLENFGLQRLLDFFAQQRSDDLDPLLDGLLEHLQSFVNNASHDDDITVFAIEYLGLPDSAEQRDRRNFPRFRMPIETSFAAPRTPVIDIGYGGALVYSDHKLAIGTREELDLILPDQTIMKCQVKIVRIQEADEPDAPARYKISTQFLDLTDHEWQQLISMCAR